MPQRHRQRADVIVMAMRNRNGIHLRIPGLVEHRQTGAAFAFWMHSGVEQNTVLVHLHEPPARADVSVGIQVGDSHKKLRLEEQNIPVVKLQLKLALEWKIVRHSLFPVYSYMTVLKIEQFQLTLAQFDMLLGKAAEGRRSPRRCARHEDS
jgi:hypothetical protein